MTKPRIFFLNENHELTPAEKAGGGRAANYAPIDWNAKADRLSSTLRSTVDALAKSRDPTRESRYYVVAAAVPKIAKLSSDKKKAPTGEYEEETELHGEDARVLQRLGFDLVASADPQHAVVHATPETVARLEAVARSLPNESRGIQARWAIVDSFQPIAPEYRVDAAWLAGLEARVPVDVVVEMQPLLSRVEAGDVAQAIAGMFKRDTGESIVRMAADFSGRFWLRARMLAATIRSVARDFFSVDSIHPPLYSTAAAQARRRAPVPPPPAAPAPNTATMPVIGVLDTGIPEDHRLLRPYVVGRYVHLEAPAQHLGGHGSFVASRVVFGDLDSERSLAAIPTGDCAVHDIMVAWHPEKIDDKAILEALTSVRATAPHVRVFNCSFDNQSLSQLPPASRRASLALVEDLDNFIFQNDVIVVVAAGNSPRGVVPPKRYPDHIDCDGWSLGPWASSFNALTCGSFVGRLTDTGVAGRVGWPSPFARGGPGIARAPSPDLSEHGGDCDSLYRGVGLGVGGFDAEGLQEDRIGTSYAAPLLARQAAWAMKHLQERCDEGVRPFGSTVKAFLAATARMVWEDEAPKRVRKLGARTLGRGRAQADELRTPSSGAAFFVWQAVLADPEVALRVELPVPAAWLAAAGDPVVDLTWAWDTPANAAVGGIWACRRVHVTLHHGEEGPGLAGYGRNIGGYPLAGRQWSLKESGGSARWVLNVRYENLARTPPTFEVASQQRVGMVARLFDRAETAADPQPYVQALPIAATMTRLPRLAVELAVPIRVRAR